MKGCLIISIQGQRKKEEAAMVGDAELRHQKAGPSYLKFHRPNTHETGKCPTSITSAPPYTEHGHRCRVTDPSLHCSNCGLTEPTDGNCGLTEPTGGHVAAVSDNIHAMVTL